jgi:pilin isopeptide linkage protein
MKSSFRGVLLAILALALCLAAPTALAAEDLSVHLNARVTLEGTYPNPAEGYIVRMTADQNAYPMPGGQTGGMYDITITGPGQGQFPVITYDRLGIYTYTVTQLAGSNADCTYDRRTYKLTVSVINAENGGLGVEVALREQGKDQKTDTALFHNAYRVIPVPTTPPGNSTPTGVNDLLPYYAGGCALLLLAAGFLLRSLLRKEGGRR